MRILLFASLIACQQAKTPDPDIIKNLPTAVTGATGATGLEGLAQGTTDCVAASGAGVSHNSNVTSDTTWTAAESPHHVTSSIYVRGGTLTIEACATVLLDQGTTISVGDSSTPGKIVTKGTVTDSNPPVFRPVYFQPATEGQHWGSLFVSEKGSLDLSTTVLSGGGDVNAVSDFGGTIVARGPNDGTLLRSLTAKLLIVTDSGGMGIVLQSGAGFTASTGPQVLVFNVGTQTKPAGSGPLFDWAYPVFVQPPGIGTLPQGAYVNGNGEKFTEHDQILVYTQQSVGVDEQFHNYGVPFRIETPFYLQPKTTAKLTVDEGAVLNFVKGSGMTLGDSGKPATVEIKGSAEHPVIFTSNETTPAAGDWYGLILPNSPASGNTITHAKFKYAGAMSGYNGFGCGPGDNDAAIIIANWKPNDAFIQNVEITDSAGGGIVCGWESNDPGPNLRTGNNFSAISNGCNVSHWRLTDTNFCPKRPEDECL